MKLAAKQLPAFLKNPAASSQAVLVYGPDEGQVREHARNLLKAVVDDPKDPFAVEELSDDALKDDMACLADALFALSLMGGRRAVWLESDSDKVGKFLSELYAEGKKPEAYLVIVAGELTPRSTLRALFEAHPQLQALACYRDEGYSLTGVISQHFQTAGMRLSRDVVDYLADNLGNDRQVTRSELDKILLYLGDDKELSVEVAMELVGNRSETSMDDYAGALADGKWQDVEKVGQRLLREGAVPIMVIRSFQRYFQRLHLMKATMLQTRQSSEQVIEAAKPKVFFRQKPILQRQLGSWELGMLEQVLQILTQAERASKETGSSPEAILQDAVLQILTLYVRARRASNSAA